MYEITLVYKLTLNSTVCVKETTDVVYIWMTSGQGNQNQRGARKNAKDH